MSYVSIMCTAPKKYTFLFIIIGINYETAGTSPGSRKSSYFLVNQKQNEKWLKHVTSSALVKCISMIVSVVMPSYPAITFFIWYVTSEN